MLPPLTTTPRRRITPFHTTAPVITAGLAPPSSSPSPNNSRRRKGLSRCGSPATPNTAGAPLTNAVPHRIAGGFAVTYAPPLDVQTFISPAPRSSQYEGLAPLTP